MKIYGEHILDVQPPVNWQLEGTSAWINMLTGADQPSGVDKNSGLGPTV